MAELNECEKLHRLIEETTDPKMKRQLQAIYDGFCGGSVHTNDEGDDGDSGNNGGPKKPKVP